MGEKLVVGPVNKGLRNDRTPFVIDNDSFPTLLNAYQWRGRVKRKRGTQLLGRLDRYFDSTSTAYNSGSSTITLNGSGVGNLINGFSLQSNGTIYPGTVVITVPGPTIYTDNGDGTFSPSGTINYASGQITIVAEAGNSVSAAFNYYPDLPVMGLRDFTSLSTQFPGTLAFDTTYAYNILRVSPYDIYSVSFYKNPPVSASLPGYVPKTTVTPITWNGQDYQQFWTTNYQNALWATNGIEVPFDPTNIGMQYKPIVTVTVIAGGPPAIVSLQITGHGLVVGDFLFINEVVTTTGINLQTGYVITVTDANNVVVEFPDATIATNGNGGIAQYLTNRSDITKDCIRWYDGDPTDGSSISPLLSGNQGWVNFCPPLSSSNFSIADLPLAKYYLVGARMIVSFKDRLLFLGPVVQTSAIGSQIYLRDTIIYSQNGTPYYTASFTGDPLLPTTVFNPILLPVNQTSSPVAYFEDVTGFGGFVSAGVDQEILTTDINEDVLIIGFTRLETRLVYSGSDIVPFNFFIINSELGSGSTFSSITLDKGVMSRGSRGFIITSQVESRRFDLEIPDEVFEVRLLENGTERVCAQRDYINEWVYFTYPSNSINYKFPTQSLQYNYRDDSWAIFRECYTTYGIFRKQTGFTWATVGNIFETWNEWNESWDAGESTLLNPQVIGGNQQGFVLIKGIGTGEGTSLYIKNIVNSVVTSPDHCLNDGDFIIITAALGTVSTQVNGKIFQVSNTSQNSFILSPPLPTGLTYLGNAVITRMYAPYIQTKQFPVSWGLARKTRLGPQQYLLTKTTNSQITLLIFLSQDGDDPYNDGPIVPDPNATNNALIYSTVLFTCPESTNIGLTPANTNLQMVTAGGQNQIWHRKNTSLLGDTIQVGFTLSKEQMLSLTPMGEVLTITGATQAAQCVLTCDNDLSVGQMVRINGVVGMVQLNFNSGLYNYYMIVARNDTTITLDVDSTTFSTYLSGGSLQVVAPIYQFAEIELHGFILDVSPSQLLA